MRSQWSRSECLIILELKIGASKKEIKVSFHRLAQIWHPDVTKKDKVTAAEKFKTISSAYSFLTDDTTIFAPEKQQSYAQRPTPQSPSSGRYGRANATSNAVYGSSSYTSNTVHYDGTSNTGYRGGYQSGSPGPDGYYSNGQFDPQAAWAWMQAKAASERAYQDKKRQEDANLQNMKDRALKKQREHEIKEGLIQRVLSSITEEEWKSGMVRRIINVPDRLKDGGKVKVNLNMTWFMFTLEPGRPSGFTYKIEGITKWGFGWEQYGNPDVRIVVYFD